MWRVGNSVSELLASCSRLFRGSNEAAAPDARQAGPQQKRHRSSSCTPSADAGLGVDLLAHVLACVPRRERLTCCALVCKDWAAAAAAATSSIDKLGSYQPDMPLDAYLARHGSHVRELRLGPAKYRGLEPLRVSALQPLQGLQLLRLDHILLQQPDAGSAVDVAAALASSLTHLQLGDCTWSVADGLRSLGALSNLQYLQLCHVRVHSRGFAIMGGNDNAGLDRALAQLTRLTHLTVASELLLTGPFRQLSCLQQLRELELPVRGEAPTASLSALPGSLTALRLVASGDPWQLGPATAPGLAALTALQWLSLAGPITDPYDEDELLSDELTVTFSANLLAQPSMAQLTHLHVRGGGSEFMPQFLAAALPSLTQLQHLQLEVVLNEQVPAAALSSLGALTRLTQLALREFSCDWPLDAVQHMFGGPRRLPALRVLHLSCDQPWPNVVDSDGEEMSDDDVPNGAVHTPDIATIVTCCPGLQELNLTHALAPGCSLKRLERLGLTRLRLGGKGVTDAALEEVGQLSSLRCLVLGGRPQCFSFAGLLHLLPLRSLTRLAALCCFGGDEDNIGDAFWEEHDDNTRVFDFRSYEQTDPHTPGSGNSSIVVWRELFSHLVLHAEDEVADEVAAMRQRLSAAERQCADARMMLAEYQVDDDSYDTDEDDNW